MPNLLRGLCRKERLRKLQRSSKVCFQRFCVISNTTLRARSFSQGMFSTKILPIMMQPAGCRSIPTDFKIKAFFCTLGTQKLKRTHPHQYDTSVNLACGEQVQQYFPFLFKDLSRGYLSFLNWQRLLECESERLIHSFVLWYLKAHRKNKCALGFSGPSNDLTADV